MVTVGRSIAYLGERRRERRVVDDAPRAGVGQQVLQLLGDVAVVHVERRDPCLVGAEHALEVLGAVVEVEGEVVLTGLVWGQLVALGTEAKAPVEQRIGEASRAVAELSVGESTVTGDDAGSVGPR